MDCLGAWIRIRCGPRAAWIATGDRDDPAVLRSADRRQHRTDRDPSRAEYAPSDPAGYSVALSEGRRIFAASAAGAKERVAPLGAHTIGVPAPWSRGGSDAAPGPLTQASAPSRAPTESSDSLG